MGKGDSVKNARAIQPKGRFSRLGRFSRGRFIPLPQRTRLTSPFRRLSRTPPSTIMCGSPLKTVPAMQSPSPRTGATAVTSTSTVTLTSAWTRIPKSPPRAVGRGPVYGAARTGVQLVEVDPRRKSACVPPAGRSLRTAPDGLRYFAPGTLPSTQ